MTIWYPYSQMKTADPSIHVTSANGVMIHCQDGRALIDAISSWWCMIHGYTHPILVDVIQTQAAVLPHIMLGGLTHDPAKRLAAKLAEVTPGDLQYVFYGDSGSVGVEIALKMAIQYFRNQGQFGRSKIAFLSGAYHGDTFGAMSVSDTDDGMHTLFSDAVLPHIKLPQPPPMGGDVSAYLTQVEVILDRNRDVLCGLIVEPIMQGAGGFKLYDPKILSGFRSLCNHFGLLLICDEVATGFGRLGVMFASELANIVPDIMVLGKALTGGHIGLSATIARPHVYEKFWSDSPEKALMHGPTFMGNPLACSVALESIRLVSDPLIFKIIARINQQLERLFVLNGVPGVKKIRVMGALGVIEVMESQLLTGASQFAAERGVWLRPFGTVLYTTPPYIISEDELDRVIDVMIECIYKTVSH